MRKVLLVLFVAGLMQSVAFAEVDGVWKLDTGVAGMDRWTLTVTPDSTIVAFDVGVWDTNGASKFVPAAATYSASVDGTTHVLLQKSHGATADLSSALDYVDANDLGAAFAVNPSPGIYANGWSAPMALLQVVVPTGAYGAPTAANGWNPVGISIGDSSEGGVPDCQEGTKIFQIHIIPGTPEPGTLVLLSCGLFGLLAYAWRKRK